MRRVLLTGGAGFIGAHVARELRRHGLEPVSFDLRAAEGMQSIVGNVLDAPAVATAMAEVDAVVHLASMLSVEATERDPRGTLDVALLGTRNVCAAVLARQRVVFASTSEVYGDAAVVPTPESCAPSPKSVYGVAKLAAEAYVRTLGDSTILRYFSVYGPAQRPSFVIPRFVQQALEGRPLTVYGDGAQVRAFCHVEDVARATVAALLVPHARGRTYNVGNPDEPIRMVDLARRVIQVTGSTSSVEQVPFSDSDRSAEREIYRRVPDVTAAAKGLGYEPTIGLDEGIASVSHHARGRSHVLS